MRKVRCGELSKSVPQVTGTPFRSLGAGHLVWPQGHRCESLWLEVELSEEQCSFGSYQLAVGGGGCWDGETVVPHWETDLAGMVGLCLEAQACRAHGDRRRASGLALALTPWKVLGILSLPDTGSPSRGFRDQHAPEASRLGQS